jgi:hypothetical protein
VERSITPKHGNIFNAVAKVTTGRGPVVSPGAALAGVIESIGQASVVVGDTTLARDSRAAGGRAGAGRLSWSRGRGGAGGLDLNRVQDRSNALLDSLLGLIGGGLLSGRLDSGRQSGELRGGDDLLLLNRLTGRSNHDGGSGGHRAGGRSRGWGRSINIRLRGRVLCGNLGRGRELVSSSDDDGLPDGDPVSLQSPLVDLVMEMAVGVEGCYLLSHGSESSHDNNVLGEHLG